MVKRPTAYEGFGGSIPPITKAVDAGSNPAPAIYLPHWTAMFHLEELADTLNTVSLALLIVWRSLDPDSRSKIRPEAYAGVEIAFRRIVTVLIRARATARTQKQFDKADEIRNTLNNIGVSLKDNPDGTTQWDIAQR